MSQPSSDRTGPERLLAISDGVFAIAMTLMVLQLEVPKLPEAEAGAIGRAVLDLWPDFFVFVLSFVVVGGFWMAHHQAFSGVRACDDRTRWLNLWFLLGVSFLPFPTGLVGEYGDQRFPAIFYAASMAATSLLLTRLIWHVRKDPALLEAPEATSQSRLKDLAVPGVFLLSIPLAFLSVSGAELSWAAIPVVERVLGRSQK